MKDYKILESKYKNLFHESFYGVECNDGWYNLLEEMLEELKDTKITINQIKSKYADLRVYFESPINLDKIIEKYEEKAIKTCEFCGKRGERRDTRWIRVLCNSCYVKKFFKYKDVFKINYYKYYICG